MTGSVDVKVVQSLWTRPLTSRGAGREGGWPSKRLHLMSWALSCLRLRSLYDEVELVTDLEGERLLVGVLALPYSTVRADLEVLAETPPYLWALGKLHAYRLQQGPFAHVDSDVYLWRRLPRRVAEAPLFAQSREQRSPTLARFAAALATDCVGLPPWFKVSAEEALTEVPSYNAGVLGGADRGAVRRVHGSCHRLRRAERLLHHPAP